jgi:hypothetical protein
LSERRIGQMGEDLPPAGFRERAAEAVALAVQHRLVG